MQFLFNPELCLKSLKKNIKRTMASEILVRNKQNSTHRLSVCMEMVGTPVIN